MFTVGLIEFIKSKIMQQAEKKTIVFYQIFDGHAWDIRHFKSESEAIEAANKNKKRQKNDGNDNYWNSLNYTVQKVTKTTEDIFATA